MLPALTAILFAAQPASESVVNRTRELAETGRFVHALRGLDQNLERQPDNPELLALRAQIQEAFNRDQGRPTRLPAAADGPPPIPNRVAEPGRDFTAETGEIPMIWIAPGSFHMCNPRGSDDDTLVTLSRGYWLGRTEVTQEQWQALIENATAPSHFKGSDRPVERTSWISAMEFCRKFTERERAAGRLPADYEYTLPTEAQWEYACRAGTTGPHAGNIAAMAWFELNSGSQTHPVAQKRPNAWGLYDMHGNVWEWCADGYAGYPGGKVTDPMVGYDSPSASIYRILRGGSWGNSAGVCRSAARAWTVMNLASSGSGFRLALAPIRQPATAAKAGGG